jgi:hypothetical protein
MKKFVFVFLLASAFVFGKDAGKASNWRAATDGELRPVIPARAPVEKERIETEFRTASGVTDGEGKFVAGVVLITAGYSADGKYSHFFLTQVPVKIGNFTLKPGDYVFGFRKNDNSLTVKFYDAQTGNPVGTVEATRASRVGKIESFHISPPSEKGVVQIGRFAFAYEIGE